MGFVPLRRRLARLMLAAALAAAIPAGSHAAPAAQSLPLPVIAVVDVQRILRDSDAAKGVQKQLEAQRQTYLKEIGSQEKELRDAEQDLERQRGNLPTDALSQKRQDLERRFAEVQQNVDQRKRILEQANNEALQTIHGAMMQIVSEVAQERKANLVLPPQVVVFVDPGLDITATVMERLNAKLPQVAVKIPK